MAYSRFEGFFHSFDSTKIFYQFWKPEVSKTSAPTHKATIIITHGQGEHTESYLRVVNHFENKGYEVWAWDMRGHGRSEGLRGYAKSFMDYVEDYVLFLDLVLSKIDRSKPIFLLSHSMGGLVQLSGLLKRPQTDFAAQTLSAPLLGVAVAVPAIKKHGAELLERFLPKLTLGNEVKYDMLTREPEIMKEFDRDPLRHNKISSGVYLGFMRQIDVMMAQAENITLPTLLQCPEKDPLCDTPSAIKFLEHIGTRDKKVLLYGNGARHEMFNDTHRAEVFKDLELFLESHLKGPS